MKKFTKWFIIIAVLMIVIGMGLFIGGVVAAGGVEATRSVLYGSDISHRTNGILEWDGDGFEINLHKHHQSAAHHTEEKSASFDAQEVKSLELELGEAEVEIVENASAEEIVINTNGCYDIYVKNDVLYVKAKKCLKDHTVFMEIPANTVFEQVDISVGACDMNIESIEAKEFDVEVGAGQVTIEDLIANNAEFEIGVGEVIVDYGNVQECDINVGMGNFEYNGVITKYSNIECGMGNTELQLEGSEKDYNYEIDCAAGNVTIGHESFSGLASERTINNHVDASMEIDCSMGNVTIGF